MTWFLLGMLVMWFCYPLLKATQTTMVVKWNNLTMNKEEINETTFEFKNTESKNQNFFTVPKIVE